MGVRHPGLFGSTSIGAMAARAGVGKDTIYRRWAGKRQLVFEAVFTTTDHTPNPDTGNLAGDLTVLPQGLVEEFHAPAAAAALPGLLADFAADPAPTARIRSVLTLSVGSSKPLFRLPQWLLLLPVAADSGGSRVTTPQD
ncbi:TetR/AcrR family transcriptional regulator [Streptomyces sp. NBC_01210]|nr:TetR/AcrR family transcriptional regulator [Streptomyces sp. NBC_01210]